VVTAASDHRFGGRPTPLRRKGIRRAIAVLGVLVLAATACSGDSTVETVTSDGETTVVTGSSDQEITFWTTEIRAERLAVTQSIIDGFTAATGITVRLVSIEEAALSDIMVSNAAAGTLPDLVYHPVDFSIEWAAQGLLNPGATDTVLNELGSDTFNQGALELVRYRGLVAAVPSDGWGQLLVYRQDLFDAAGLDVPDTFEKIEVAAAALTDPNNDFYGITAASDADQVFMQQTFEHFALANDCELTDVSGAVTLDSANCVETIEFYAGLLADYGPPVAEGVVETRGRYLAGNAAMVVWSPLIMDEMAGLRDAALPTCPECGDDLAFLARNSGFVPFLTGPRGSPGQYGQLSSLGIGASANTAAAGEFIRYWLTDGYVDWLSTSPESKLPMRRGTADDPTEFLDRWRGLEIGVDRRAPFNEFYGDDTLTALVLGHENVARWGLPQGQSELVSAVYSSLPIGREVRSVLDGSKSAREAAAAMQTLVEEEQKLLG
jgi:multiple sugar transport system substrate-binding protein